MKKFLSNRLVALFLSALIVAGSTLVSVHAKLGAQCDKIADGFYTGVRYDGDVHASISSQLKDIIGCAEGLVTIANNYEVDAELSGKVRQSVDSLNLSMTRSRSSISSLYSEYQDLSRSVSALADALGRQALSDSDKSAVEQYNNGIAEAQSLIASAGYNESVRTFTSKKLRFPASLLGPIAGVHFPEYFA